MANAALRLEESAPTGLILDRYRPLRPLGSGGSGSVWLARDERNGLDVALKIVAREGKAAARAEREAAAAARLRHPSCLRAYSLSRDPRHVYIAYEFVPGRTFREAMRAGELKDRDAVEACAQVCDGLAHAHAAGVLHRDVKPSNVLLADSAAVSVRLLDFGLAQLTEAETLTAHGDVPGTLAYIAPERLAGADATGAVDVWGVGVMLWEALAGRHPFWQSSMLETARAIEVGAPSLATMRPDLPKSLVALVDRALSTDPARRPAAAELAGGLRGAAAPRRRRPTRTPRVSLPTLPHVSVPGTASLPRFGAAALAALFAGWIAAEIPFYPHGFSAGLALAAGAVTAVRARAGLALALAVPVLPLGNISLGLGLAYAAAAACWLALSWREPRSALLFALGPLLVPLAGLALLPLAVHRVRSGVVRALQAAAGVGAAAAVAGFRHGALPFTGVRAPLGVGIGTATDPLAVVGSLARAAAAQPTLLAEAVVLAVIAFVLPYARRRGRWGAAGIGAALLAATVLAAPAAAVVPLAVAGWLTAGAVGLLGRVPGPLRG